MFTGLIEGTGLITAITRMADGVRLSAQAPFDLTQVRLGDSIAVSGPCLTVVDLAPPIFSADVSAETLERTNFTLKRVGDRVNLERALRLGDRLGGHLVTGHIDCIATLVEHRPGPQSLKLAFRVANGWSRYIIAKGSIAIDGVSLTVNTVAQDVFTVNIIPYTARHTTLLDLKMGQRVNIETDIIGKYVEKLLGPHSKGPGTDISPEFLARHGFL